MSLLKLSRSAGFAILAALSLAGCGFQPMHGPTSSGAQLSDVMKSVDIALIPGRVGQRVRNELLFGTQGAGGEAGVKSEYRLEIIVKEELRNTLVASTGDSQGQIVEINAEFKLIKLAGNQTVFTGRTAGRAALDKFDSVFADVRAKLDAENRAARTVSEAIKIRLSAYLSGNA